MPSYSHSVKYFNTFDSTFCSTNSAENQTVYSDCATLAVSCKVYYNAALSVPVTGYDFIKFGGIVHEMNFDTGEINPATDVQCPIPTVYIYRVSVSPNQTSFVEWMECEGYSGPKQLIYDRMRSIDVQAVSGSVSASLSANVSVVGNCNPYPNCECVYIGQSTTTSTTIPPVNFILTPYCTGSGVNGTGTINVNTFSGGSGVYQSVAIGNTAGQAFSATPINLSGATSYEFTGLFNGIYYVILRDSIGSYKLNSTFVDCLNTTSTTSTTSTTTSTTSTTSTTTAAPICTYNGGSAVITYTTTTTSTSTSTTAAPTSTTTSTSTTTTEAPTTSTTTSTTSTSTTTTAGPSATLQWDFEEVAGANGNMELFVNGNTIETRYITSNGTYAVYEGDTINVQVVCNTCGSPNDYSNAYTLSNKSILVDADCVQNGTASIFTSVYTVVSGDIGNTINLSARAECANGCL